MFKKLKENKKKGFTLVELIVVLVILAILAALLIPALTGYIDRAKEKDIIAETRQTVMAAQTLVDEAYAKKEIKFDNITVGDGDTYTVTTKAITELAEVKGKIGDVTVKEGKIQSLKYTKNGKTCTYTAKPADGKDQYEVGAN